MTLSRLPPGPPKKTSTLVCSVDGCTTGKTPVAHGMCTTHYQRARRLERARRLGDPVSKMRLEAPIVPRGEDMVPLSHFRLDGKLARDLDRLAAEDGVLDSQLIRAAIEEWLEGAEATDPIDPHFERLLLRECKYASREADGRIWVKPATLELLSSMTEHLGATVNPMISRSALVRTILRLYVASRA